MVSLGLRLCSLCFLHAGRHSVAGSPGPSTPVPFGKRLRDDYFQFRPGFVNFNHGGFGATPRPVRESMEHFLNQAEAQPTQWFGAGGYRAVLDGVRPQLAELMGADAADLVFLDDASSGLNAVLRSLDWRRGDLLMLTSAAYAVLPNVARWLERRYGIETIRVNITFPAHGPEAYLGPVGQALGALGSKQRQRLRLAVFDHVSSYPPTVLPLADLARLVKQETSGQGLVLADGAHALGQIPVDMRELSAAGVDLYVSDGHKWLMAPKGTGFLWAARHAQGWLQPVVISSDNAPPAGFHERFDYIGTRDYTPWCAVGAALSFRRQVLGGERRIQDYTAGLSRWAGGALARRFGTSTVAADSMTASMAAVRLPLPAAWPSSRQQECVDDMQLGLERDYSMQVIPFTLQTPADANDPEGALVGTHWIRVSAQVYLERADFESLGTAVLALLSACANRSARPHETWV